MHGNEHGVFVDLSKTSSALHRMSDTELQGLLGSAWYVTLVFVYTCWWYSLCNFQYRQQYEHTGSDNFEG